MLLKQVLGGVSNEQSVLVEMKYLHRFISFSLISMRRVLNAERNLNAEVVFSCLERKRVVTEVLLNYCFSGAWLILFIDGSSVFC